MNQSAIRCACCPKGLVDPSFRREDGYPLYWLAVEGGKIYFCGPIHATEWATKETKNHSGEDQQNP